MSVHDGAAAAIQLAVGLGAMLGCALPLCVAPGVRAARKRLSASVAASTPEQAPAEARKPQKPAQARTARRAPSWAHTDHHNHHTRSTR